MSLLIEQIAKSAGEHRKLVEALIDIEELVEDYADVDDGQPNLAMRVLVVTRIALGKPLS